MWFHDDRRWAVIVRCCQVTVSLSVRSRASERALADLRLLLSQGDQVHGPDYNDVARLHLQEFAVEADFEGLRLTIRILQGQQAVAWIDTQHFGVGLEGLGLAAGA